MWFIHTACLPKLHHLWFWSQWHYFACVTLRTEVHAINACMLLNCMWLQHSCPNLYIIIPLENLILWTVCRKQGKGVPSCWRWSAVWHCEISNQWEVWGAHYRNTTAYCSHHKYFNSTALWKNQWSLATIGSDNRHNATIMSPL